MLLERFYDAGLAQASYLIGCAATGEASSSTRIATWSRTCAPRPRTGCGSRT